jgi:hypothetical protein
MEKSKLDELISEWLDGRIGAADSVALQKHLRESPEARARFRGLTRIDAVLRTMAAGDDQFLPFESAIGAESSKSQPQSGASWGAYFATSWLYVALAASLLACVGLFAYQAGKTSGVATKLASPIVPKMMQISSKEKKGAGYATLRRAAGVQWQDGFKGFREGDILPAGILEIGRGVAEIDFFCGATVVVEGPAKLDFESDWSVRLLAGRIRANVPPAAQGFVVKVADSEVVDLGTEFALEVDSNNVRVAVVDGEIKLRGGKHDGQHLTTGQGKLLKGAELKSDFVADLSTIGDVGRLYDAGQKECFERWQACAKKLKKDDRLIAYYSMATAADATRTVSNLAATGKLLDGKLVGAVAQAGGRFGDTHSSLAFDRLGSRIRAKVDGEFKAFTFACWAKIDRLEHRFNALLMGDGYEDGEPHWQIRNDGKLMLSVMVDAAPSSRDGVDEDGNWHHVYLTPVVWDDSLSGQWMHIGSVYDPKARLVRQYINGREVSREKIKPEFFVDSLRVGAAEIGNWGQPFRESPDFAVRNLNGAIDEMLLFKAALSSEEIMELFENGKPFGY